MNFKIITILITFILILISLLQYSCNNASKLRTQNRILQETIKNIQKETKKRQKLIQDNLKKKEKLQKETERKLKIKQQDKSLLDIKNKIEDFFKE